MKRGYGSVQSSWIHHVNCISNAEHTRNFWWVRCNVPTNCFLFSGKKKKRVTSQLEVWVTHWQGDQNYDHQWVIHGCHVLQVSLRNRPQSLQLSAEMHSLPLTVRKHGVIILLKILQIHQGLTRQSGNFPEQRMLKKIGQLNASPGRRQAPVREEGIL